MNQLLRLHQRLYEATNGRIGHRLLGVPTLLLTTTGRRSGEARRVALVYAEHDGRLAVVASWGGSPNHPGWFHNLVADPMVTVQVGRNVGQYSARVVEGDEHNEWWDRANAVNRDRYDEYQTLTERRIPVVVLEEIS